MNPNNLFLVTAIVCIVSIIANLASGASNDSTFGAALIGGGLSFGIWWIGRKKNKDSK